MESLSSTLLAQYFFCYPHSRDDLPLLLKKVKDLNPKNKTKYIYQIYTFNRETKLKKKKNWITKNTKCAFNCLIIYYSRLEEVVIDFSCTYFFHYLNLKDDQPLLSSHKEWGFETLQTKKINQQKKNHKKGKMYLLLLNIFLFCDKGFLKS